MSVRGPAAVLLSLLALLVLAPSASADEARHADARDDLWQPVGFDGWEPAAVVPNADLVRTVLRHERDRVVVRARYARLVDRADEVSLEAVLRTPGHRWTLRVDASDNRGGARLFAGRREVDCDLRTRVSLAEDFVRVNVPRGCLDRPAWVRAAVLARRYDERAGLVWDDAWSDGHPVGAGTWTDRVRPD